MVSKVISIPSTAMPRGNCFFILAYKKSKKSCSTLHRFENNWLQTSNKQEETVNVWSVSFPSRTEYGNFENDSILGFLGQSIREWQEKLGCYQRQPALSENFWRISLYVNDDAIANFTVCYVKFHQIEGNGKKFRHICTCSRASHSVNT